MMELFNMLYQHYNNFQCLNFKDQIQKYLYHQINFLHKIIIVVVNNQF